MPDLSGRSLSLVDVIANRLVVLPTRIGRTPLVIWCAAPILIRRWVALAMMIPLVGGAYWLGSRGASPGKIAVPQSKLQRVAGQSTLRLDRSIRKPLPRTADPSGAFGPPVVVGIVGRLPGDAIVMVKDGSATRMVAVGSAIFGWRLVGLSPTTAVFTRGGEQQSVELPATE